MLIHTHVPRLSALPSSLTLLVQTRLAHAASSTNNIQFPFPPHARPSPHQIFHLPLGASQKDIKARYYDLVRVHHPDSALCRDLSPSERHLRFQAITAAYDALRGKVRSTSDPYEAEIRRRRRAHQYRRTDYDYDFASPGGSGKEWTASADDRWKDWIIISVGVISLIVGFGPLFFISPVLEQRHLSAVANLSQARSEAREFGQERRRQIRRRVREYEVQREQEERKDTCIRGHRTHKASEQKDL